jgi:hypothetical protein
VPNEAEIIPFEPDPGNAGVGIGDNYKTNMSHILIQGQGYGFFIIDCLYTPPLLAASSASSAYYIKYDCGASSLPPRYPDECSLLAAGVKV